MFCRNCGTSVAEGAAFCANCGTSTADQAGGGAVALATSGDTGASSGVNLSPESSGNVDELLMMVKQHLGNDYRIDKELGRGGMAVVYKGVESALERVVAIKVVPPESANAGQAAERFKREARLAASLDHPNIIPVYRVGQAGPLHFMAMKFVEGRAVDAIIEQQGALPVPIAIAILKYAALGLAFAHEKKIIHRDVKGANILVDKDGRVMMSDFGIARALEEVSLTASGMMIGTPYFMSPEQCGGQKVSPQSDQYSLGILGFQLLTGEVPFNADSMVGIIQHHYMTQPPDITAVRQDVPKELLDIIYCSLNKDPGDRFATTKEMATALENVPISDADREEAEKALKVLSAGQAIPKVRTGTLPPLALTISGPGPRVQPRPVTTPRARPAPQVGVRKVSKKRKKKNKMIPVVAGFVMLLLGGAGYMMYSQQQAQAAALAQQQKADSVRLAQQRAAALARSRGNIVVMGMPQGVPVQLAGRAYLNGQVATLDTATYIATATADGYEPLSQPVIVKAATTDTVTFTMTPSSAANQVGNAVGTRNVPRAPSDSNEVRFAVTPLYVQIWVDGTQIGSGRARSRLAVGPHHVRYYAPNCTPEEIDIEVVKGGAQPIPLRQLTCQ
jgi:serine/threonine protein kinase